MWLDRETRIVSVESPWWVPGAERVCSSESERMSGGGISEGARGGNSGEESSQ